MNEYDEEKLNNYYNYTIHEKKIRYSVEDAGLHF